MKKFIKQILTFVAIIFIGSTSVLLVSCEKTHTHTLIEVERVEATSETDGNIHYWYCSECGKYFSDAAATEVITLEDTIIPANTSLIKVDANEATCDSDGNSEFWYNTEDGKYYSDAEATTEIELSDTVIEATGHTLTHYEAIAATCESDGNTEYWYCSECGKYYSDEAATDEITLSDIIIVAGHTLTYHEAIAATCESDGNIEYYYCSECEKYYSDAACTNEITGSVVIEATGHTLTHYEAIAATCESDGNTEYYYCSECEKYYSDAVCTNEITGSVIIPATGHTLTHYEAIAATCESDGNTEYWYCSECGKYFKDEEGTKEIREASTVISATHALMRYVAKVATCETNGNIEYWYCTACGKYYSDSNATIEISKEQTVIQATGHSYELINWTWSEDYSSATAAFACSVCGGTKSITATVTNETTNATCTAAGEIIYTATVTLNGLEYTDTQKVTIPATGHSYGTTLTYSDGIWYKTCLACEGKLDDGKVAVTSNYENYTFLADTAEALSSALALGGSTRLTADISDENSSVSFEVPSTVAATLDLNSYAISLTQGKSILVEGALTINGNGSVTNNIAVCLFKVEGGTLTLNGGTYTNSEYYGIYCLNGGTAIINGGTFTSKYSVLSGNNTTGNMNFEVNGGTITAENGPAIYMPGQVYLTVTGGTINGGISLRMGIVNITGGTINATTGETGSISNYYNYSGNVFLADAIYVMAGTYTSKDSNGNKFILNISGDAKINCTNSSGSAVAIYDLGKVEQSVTVSITGGTLSTNSTSRLAYQVISFSEIGVENSAYGTYSGSVVSNISVSTAEDLANAISSGSGTINITLTDDITITSDAFIGSVFIEDSTTALNMAIDVDGHTLTINKDETANGTSIKLYNSKSLTFTDSSNENGSSSTRVGLVLNNRANNTEASCIFVGEECSLTMNNIVVNSVGCTLYVAGTASQINVLNSRVITTGSYVIGTNAGTVDNYGVAITINESYLEANEENGWSCVVLINVAGTLKITDSTIVGQMQGVAVRAGTATITGTTITCTIAESQITENMIKYTNMTKSWGSSPDTAIGAIVVGNITSNTYLADATLTLSNCTLSYTIIDDTDNDYSEYKIALYLVRTGNSEYKTEVTMSGTNSITGYVINISGGDDYTSTLTGYEGTVYDTWNGSAWTDSTANGNSENE